MASTYSTNLALELIGTGDQSGTWGATTNTNLGTLLEQAIVGYTTQALAGAGPTAITIPNGATGVARNYVLEFTGSPTAGHTVTVPAVQKSYVLFNNTTVSIVVKVSGQTGVTIAVGKKAIVYNNGTDIIEVANAPVTEAGTQTLTNKTLTAPTMTAPVLGTPASGTVTNLTGTASININGTVGATTATTGAFTTLSASSTVSGTGFSTYLASPPAIGGTVAAAGTFTTATAATVVGTHNAYANIIALTDAATIAVDMSVTGGNNFSVTLAGNRTLGNPTGLTAGQSGIIYVTQDATGSRTLAYSSYWKFPGGTAPTLTTAANSVDALVYTVRTSTSITVQSLLNIA
jgi:hypothetical protein